MQVRGRGDRISFADSFKDIYNFRLLYGSSVAFFPIKVWGRTRLLLFLPKVILTMMTVIEGTQVAKVAPPP